MYKTKLLAAALSVAFLLPPIAIACATKNDQLSQSAPSFSMESSFSGDYEANESASNPSSNTSSTNSSSANHSSTTNSSSSANSSATQNSGNSSQTPQPTYAQYIRCTGDSVNIRAGAGTDFAVLGTAKKGTMYAIIGKSNGWYKTYYRNKVAYISASYASVFSLEKSNDADVENVLKEGYKLIGTPYVYGAVRLHDGKGKLLSGFTVQKFDCSSLVQYVFYKGANELLQVNTRTQVTQGKYVKPSDLQRGDCIFFTNEERQYNTGVERIGHVAVYLGNDYILHTASDYARIEKMSAYRWNFYVEARRFL